MNKFLVLFFVIALAGCCSQKGWIYRETISDYPQFNSAQLKYVADNQFHGIEVQFLKGNFGVLGFLNVCSRQIPSIAVEIQIEGYQYSYLGIPMEGGQRLLLPEEATTLMIQALLAGNKVVVILEGFSTELFPANFSRLYFKL